MLTEPNQLATTVRNQDTIGSSESEYTGIRHIVNSYIWIKSFYSKNFIRHFEIWWLHCEIFSLINGKCRKNLHLQIDFFNHCQSKNDHCFAQYWLINTALWQISQNGSSMSFLNWNCFKKALDRIEALLSELMSQKDVTKIFLTKHHHIILCPATLSSSTEALSEKYPQNPKMKKKSLAEKSIELNFEATFSFEMGNNTPGYHRDIFRPPKLVKAFPKKNQSVFLRKKVHVILLLFEFQKISDFSAKPQFWWGKDALKISSVDMHSTTNFPPWPICKKSHF